MLPLAAQARIQGDVHLVAGGESVKLVVSPYPLLSRIAADITKEFTLSSETKVVYHFVLVNSILRVTRTTQQRGDAFGRLILRALRKKTQREGNRLDSVRAESEHTQEPSRSHKFAN